MQKLDYSEFDRKPNSNLDHIPGTDGWPLIGDTIGFLTNTKALGEELYNNYGRIVRSNALFQRSVILFGPEAAELVLKDNEGIFSSKLAWDPILDRVFPNGLMLRDFDDHKFHRKIIQSAFRKEAIEGYLQRMNPMLRDGAAQWPQDEFFSFQAMVKALLLDVAATVFLGVDVGEEADKLNKAFIDAMMASIAVVKLPLPGTRWRRGLQGRAYLEQFVDRYIDEKRRTESNDFFSRICHAQDEDGNTFDNAAVRDHTIFLLFAAHDTTTSTLCSMIYCLAKHPEWQQRLRTEFQALNSEVLDYDQLNALPDTKLVLQEALRMYPPLPSIVRRTTCDTEIFGYKVPRNTGVVVSPLHTHYMSEFWSNPESFDPERFSPARAEHKKHFFQWMPFGGGRHKCIGLNFAEVQVKIFLFHLLRRYEVSVRDGYVMPYSSVPLSFPSDGLPVRITPLS